MSDMLERYKELNFDIGQEYKDKPTMEDPSSTFTGTVYEKMSWNTEFLGITLMLFVPLEGDHANKECEEQHSKRWAETPFVTSSRDPKLIGKAIKQALSSTAPAPLHTLIIAQGWLSLPGAQPTEQDIVHYWVRTIGITDTTFMLREHELLMVDVGGPKSERTKWIYCFQDVTSILSLVSFSGCDQCLVEDKDARIDLFPVKTFKETV
ncbi:G-protein alpha subunit-domain-containing protein [Flammula alnicola]|nr:G-protein alpha subunit-domain-containing protein [Flammula alnicola]